jgi:hypothetical protein
MSTRPADKPMNINHPLADRLFRDRQAHLNQTQAERCAELAQEWLAEQGAGEKQEPVKVNGRYAVLQLSSLQGKQGQFLIRDAGGTESYLNHCGQWDSDPDMDLTADNYWPTRQAAADFIAQHADKPAQEHQA